jgi:hypothetical protein
MFSAVVVGASMRVGRSVVTDRLVGIILGTALFVLFPAFIIAGAKDCASTNPGFHCALVKLVFEDGPAGRLLPMRQAKSE